MKFSQNNDDSDDDDDLQVACNLRLFHDFLNFDSVLTLPFIFICTIFFSSSYTSIVTRPKILTKSLSKNLSFKRLLIQINDDFYVFFSTEGLVSYIIPKGTQRGNEVELSDKTYDGDDEGDRLLGGLGQLVDGQKGVDNFRSDVNGYGKGKADKRQKKFDIILSSKSFFVLAYLNRFFKDIFISYS